MTSIQAAHQDSGVNKKLVDYECKKTTQALNYLLRKSDTNSLHKIVLVKLLWAADRYHLRNYARLVCSEEYVAMGNGPVGSLAKDIIYERTEYGLPEDCLPYTSAYLSKKDDAVSSLQETDTDYLSESDLEALEFAWKNFGELKDDLEALVEVTHRYPEWDRHRETLEINRQAKSAKIDLEDFYEEPRGIKDDPFAMDEELKRLSREMFKENSQVKILLAQ